MHKKKIVHLISSLKIGGAESLLYDLIIGLGNEDYEHYVVYFHDGPNAQRLRDIGISLHHVQGLVCLYDPWFVSRLYTTIKTINPDLIHSALWAANFLGKFIARMLHIPIVCAVHLGVDLDGVIRNALDRINFNWATHVIAVSDGVEKSIRNKQWLHPEDVTVIPNGIDVDAIVQRTRQLLVTREDIGLSEEHFVIGSVGRFIPRKNYSLLVKSFAQVYKHNNAARLVLVGLGPQEQLLRALAEELRIAHAVIFVVGKSAYSYYPLFDCFVLSSEQEGLSIALLEAMSCALPCIVTASDQLHEVIEHNITGFLVDLDEYSLTQQLITCVDNKMLCLHIGNEGQKMLKDKFNLISMIHAYRNVFKSATNR